MNSRGFSLVEMVFAIVILGLGAAVFAHLINISSQNSVDPNIRQQAIAIAQAYLEEVLAKSFCDPDWDDDNDPDTPLDCPLACNSRVCDGCRIVSQGADREMRRDQYDDICDYRELSNTPPVDQNGTSYANLSGYTVRVQVMDSSDTGGDLLGGGFTLVADQGRSARIDVRVTHPSLSYAVEVSGYRTNL